jgi:hypothetical protein
MIMNVEQLIILMEAVVAYSKIGTTIPAYAWKGRNETSKAPFMIADNPFSI